MSSTSSRSIPASTISLDVINLNTEPGATGFWYALERNTPSFSLIFFHLSSISDTLKDGEDANANISPVFASRTATDPLYFSMSLYALSCKAASIVRETSAPFFCFGLAPQLL